MSLAAILVLCFVTIQRLAELVWARANTARLLRTGGLEIGAGHYKLIVGLHGAWLVGLWLLAWDKPLHEGFLAAFLVLQLARIWVLVTLGRRWTTRIIIVPGERLVALGPYRYMRHPNYAIVAGEVACLPLVFGMVGYALVFSLLNAVVLAIRMRAEDRALRSVQARTA